MEGVEHNHVGWWAIKHSDGSWMGGDKGVLCYEQQELARAAMTLLWKAQGSGKLNYEVVPYTGGATHKKGEVVTADEFMSALEEYENEQTH